MILPLFCYLLLYKFLEAVLARGTLKHIERMIQLIEETKRANLLEPGFGSGFPRSEDMSCMGIKRVIRQMANHHE